MNRGDFHAMAERIAQLEKRLAEVEQELQKRRSRREKQSDA